MKPRTTTAADSPSVADAIETARTRSLPVLARIPRVGDAPVAVDSQPNPALSGHAVPETLRAVEAVAVSAPLEEPQPYSLPNVSIGESLDIDPSSERCASEERLRGCESSSVGQQHTPKVTLASRIFRMHEAIMPHSGLIMAAALLLAAGLLGWLNANNGEYDGPPLATDYVANDGLDLNYQPQWTTEPKQEEPVSSEANEPFSPSFALAEPTKVAPSAERAASAITQDATLAPLPPADPSQGYASTGYSSDYLSGVRVRTTTEMAQRPTQKSR